MDRTDRNILDILQFDFPLTTRPWAAVARKAGCGEREVIARIKALKEKGVIRRLGPVFSSGKIGYHGTLAAFKVDPDDIDRVAGCLNPVPGVSHNYVREGDFNVWFTLTVPERQNLRTAVARLAREAAVREWLFLPAVRTFKIGLALPMSGASNATTQRAPVVGRNKPRTGQRGSSARSGVNKRFIRALQGDLSMVSRPCRKAARELGLSEGEVLLRIKGGLESGTIRRVAAVLDPLKAGYRANVLVAWIVPASGKKLLGEVAAGVSVVSHCYERPVRDGWPYSMYTMIHGRTDEECGAVIKQVAAEAGVESYRTLRTLRCLKKARMVYHDERGGKTRP